MDPKRQIFHVFFYMGMLDFTIYMCVCVSIRISMEVGYLIRDQRVERIEYSKEGKIEYGVIERFRGN